MFSCHGEQFFYLPLARHTGSSKTAPDDLSCLMFTQRELATFLQHIGNG